MSFRFAELCRLRTTGEKTVTHDRRWTEAMNAADDRGDLNELSRCFRAGIPMSDEIREMLADLFDGRKMVRRSPLTEQQEQLVAAGHHYRIGKRPGESAEQRLERIAKEYKVSENSLREFVRGGGRFSARLRREKR